MFLSTSHNKIDLKCRVSIPASFRVNLEKSNENLILFKSLQFKCIEGTTLTRMQKYINAIEDFIEIPITFISVGPERNQNIVITDD